MGRRGPIARNAWRAVKTTTPVHLEPPEELSDAALTEWRRIIPELRTMGRIASVDLGVLAAYCASYGRWLEAERFLRENGLTYVIRDKDGRTKYVSQFPQVSIANKERLNIKMFADQLGLSPSARARLSIEPEPHKSESERFLDEGI